MFWFPMDVVEGLAGSLPCSAEPAERPWRQNKQEVPFHIPPDT